MDGCMSMSTPSTRIVGEPGKHRRKASSEVETVSVSTSALGASCRTTSITSVSARAPLAQPGLLRTRIFTCPRTALNLRVP
jgi:hypothetical protein